jgi:hypothetical protein
MAISQVQQNDVGVIFRLTIIDQDEVVVDLSEATVMRFIFQKPDGTLLTGNATRMTDGKDGVIEYVALAGDLALTGTWRYQGYVEVAGSVLYTTVGKFKVVQNLPI